MKRARSQAPGLADLIALSREKGRAHALMAEAAEARGDATAAIEHRRVAGQYRQEADAQAGAGEVKRRPDWVRTAADKAHHLREPVAPARRQG